MARLSACLCVTAALVLGAAGEARAAFGFRAMWGSAGSAPGQFGTANGIAVDLRGDVYVGDQVNHRVQKFTSTGRFVTAWGTPGAAPGQFNDPYGVAVDGWGDVYVADAHNNRIQKFTSTGRFLAAWGTLGTAPGQFNEPRGVAVDDVGNVYVADHGNHRIQKLSPTGRFLAKWGRNGGDGSAGPGPGEFNQPRGMAIDRAGNIYVAEKLNHRVQELAPNGAFIRQWGGFGAAPGQLNLPYSVAIDGAGDLYVADVRNNRIQKFGPTGRLLARYGRNGGDGTAGAGPGEFDEPYGVAVDCHSSLYVAEEGNERVQKLGLPDSTAPRCPPVLSVKLDAAQRAIAHGGLTASISCDHPCTATLAGTITRAGAHALSARVVRRELMPGRPASVRVVLTRAQLRSLAQALRAGQRPQATLTATARGFAGRARAVRRLVRVAR